MKKISCLLILLLSVVQQYAQDTLFIYASTQSEFMGNYCKKLSLNELTSIPINHNFEAEYKRNISLKGDLWHWLKVNIKNTTTKDKTFLVFFHNAQLDTAQYFIVKEDKLRYTSPITGCNMPVGERPTNDRTLSLPLHIKAGEVFDLYMKIYGREFDIAVTPQLVDPVTGIDFQWTTYLYQLLFIIGILFAVVIAIITFYQRKYRLPSSEIIWFLTYVVAGEFYLIATSGFGSLYLWGWFPWFEVNAAIFFGSVSCLALLEFSRTVLDLKKSYPKTDRFFYLTARFYITCSLLGFLHFFPLIKPGFYKNLITIPYMLTLICLVMILLISFRKLKKSKLGYFGWIAGFYFFHALFYLLIICLENNIIVYNHLHHVWINVVCYVPQILLAMVYLVLKFISLIENNMNKVQNIRKQILTDIHSDIGESLTKIKLSVHSMLQGAAINDTTRLMLEKIKLESSNADDYLHELYFSTNTNDIRMEEVQSFFKEMVTSFWKYTDMVIVFDLPAPSHPVLIDSKTKSQLLMMLKEMNNNVAKHAKATEMQFSFKFIAPNKYRMEVRDNGIGFDLNQKTNSSHGLTGMKYRAEQIGAVLVIQSIPNAGTILSLTGPL